MVDTIEELITKYNEAKKKRKVRYLDWHKAKQLCSEHPNATIYAGIMEDMGNTMDRIYNHGKWCDDAHVYDHSWWGTPILEIWDDNAGEEKQIPCWTTNRVHDGSGVPSWWGKEA